MSFQRPEPSSTNDALKKLTLIDNEYAQHVLVGDDNERLPNWFLIEITKELPKLTLYHEK